MDQAAELQKIVTILGENYIPATKSSFDIYFTSHEIINMVRKILPNVNPEEVHDALLLAGFNYDYLDEIGFVWLLHNREPSF